MTRFVRVLTVAMLAWSLAAMEALAGPFGLNEGMKKEEVQILKEVSNYRYSIKPPKPHSQFELCTVKITPQTGLCFILASEKTIRTSVYEVKISNNFKEIRSQIDGVYGKSRLNDFLRSGSIWSDEKDWMPALLKKERFLQAYWCSSSGAKLKSGIREILLSTLTLSTGKAYLSLQYRFDNTEQCEKEIKKGDASKF